MKYNLFGENKSNKKAKLFFWNKNDDKKFFLYAVPFLFSSLAGNEYLVDFFLISITINFIIFFGERITKNTCFKKT